MTVSILRMSDDFKNTTFSGTKRITIRNGHRPQFHTELEIRIISNDTNWGCKANVTEVGFYTYETIPEQDWHDDGFQSWQEMFEEMKTFYPDISPQSECTIIRWGQIFAQWEI